MFGDNFPYFSYLDVVMKLSIVFRCTYEKATICFSGLSLVLKKGNIYWLTARLDTHLL